MNVTKMRHQLERTEAAAERREWEAAERARDAWLASLPVGHRQVHERGHLCGTCIQDAVNRMTEALRPHLEALGRVQWQDPAPRTIAAVREARAAIPRHYLEQARLYAQDLED